MSTRHDAQLLAVGVVTGTALGAALKWLLDRHSPAPPGSATPRAPPKLIHVIGDIYLDMIAKVAHLPEWDSDTPIELPIETCAGGSALNTAVQLSALLKTRRSGDSCVLHSQVGDDLYGRLVAERVKTSGVALSGPRVGGQGVCFCLSGQTDRAFVSYKGSVARFCESDINMEVLLSKNSAHVHFAAYFDCVGLQEAVPRLMRAAKNNGATISLVTQADPAGEWDLGGPELLPLVDVLIINETEAVSLARVVVAHPGAPTEAEVDAAIEVLLAWGVALVVVTRGKDGAIAANLDARWSQPTMKRQVVDTTGAGDAFAAGFLYGWLQEKNVRLGLIYGCACGAAAVGQMGGSQPLTRASVNECMLDTNPQFRASSATSLNAVAFVSRLKNSRSLPSPSGTGATR